MNSIEASFGCTSAILFFVALESQRAAGDRAILGDVSTLESVLRRYAGMTDAELHEESDRISRGKFTTPELPFYTVLTLFLTFLLRVPETERKGVRMVPDSWMGPIVEDPKQHQNNVLPKPSTP